MEWRNGTIASAPSQAHQQVEMRVRDFELRLADAGFETEIHWIPGQYASGGQDHIVYLCSR